MKHIFILNQQAGRAGVHERLAAELTALCQAKGADFSLHRTGSSGEADAVIRRTCGESGEVRIYACGGDGTLCGAINAAAPFPGASVGLIPIGTGNDFVRNFGESAPFLAPNAQLDGRAVKLDLLRCNDRLCANMINIGFDCEVVKEAGRLRRKRFFGEKLAYLSGVVLTLIRKPGVDLTVTPADEKAEGEEKNLLLIAIANGAFCGGGFRAAPRSQLGDGMMDVCMVNNISRTRFLSLVKSYHDGTHLDLRAAQKIIDYRQRDRLELTFPKLQSVCIDGEIIETTHLLVETIPHALRFILPRGVAWKEEKVHEAACPV